MYAAARITDVSTRSANHDLPALLLDQLLDLLLIHHQHRHSAIRDLSREELPSLYLKECRYVSGEKSAEKSCMHFRLLIGPREEAGHADEILTLELNVRSR